MRELIDEFAKMPGVGRRTAERLAFYILTADKADAERLSASIRKVNDSIRYCSKCFNLSEGEFCSICSDASRDVERVCVVEEPKDIISIEKASVFRGLYHVLLGSLSPLDGVGPQDIKIAELLQRVKTEGIKEVILGMTSDTEGEATALYVTSSDLTRAGTRYYWRIVGLTLIVTLVGVILLTLAFLTVLIGGEGFTVLSLVPLAVLFFALFFTFFAPFAIVADDAKTLQSIKISLRVTKHHFLKYAAIALILLLIYLGIGALVTWALRLSGLLAAQDTLAGKIGIGALSSFLHAIWGVVLCGTFMAFYLSLPKAETAL
jgi:recombination protein RecR